MRSSLAGNRREAGFAVAGLLALVTLACGSSESPLEPQSHLSKTLAAAEADRYRVDLETGQLLQLEIVQRGIDVALTFEDPEGHRLASVDGLLGAVGSERLLWVAERTGAYRVEVRGTAQLPDSLYEIRREPTRTANALDRQKFEAAKAFYVAGESIARNQFEQARQELLRARALWADLDDAVWLAEIDHALGYLSAASGDLRTALEHYQRVPIHPGGDALTVKTRHNIARIHLDLYELEQARQGFHEALEGWKLLADRFSEARAAHDLGVVYDDLGETSEALRYYGDALELLNQLGNQRHAALTLHNRGRAYAAQGRIDNALRDLRQALAIREAMGDTRGAAVTLTVIGQVFKNLDQLDEAMVHFQRALALQDDALKLKDPAESFRYGRAVTLVGIGEVQQRRGESGEAAELFEEALRTFREMDKLREQGYVLRNLGLTEESGNPDKAARLYDDALRLSRAVYDREQEAESLLGLARVERSRGQLTLAARHAEDALSIIEALRTTGSSGTELRSRYFATKQGYYDFYITLLMDLAERQPDGDYAARALSTSEQARARSQLDSLISAGSEPGDDSTPLIARREGRRRAIASKQFRLTELLTHQAAPEEVEALKRELRENLEELDELDGRIRQIRPLYAQLTDPQPLSATDIQSQVLDDETILLEYQLGEERSFLWAMTADSLHSFELPPQAEIEKLAQTAARLLAASDQPQYQADLEWVLETLSQILLRPAMDQLDKPRFLIVAEGALQYVPFAALPQPVTAPDGQSKGEPLIARHEIVNLPSASLLHVLREQHDDRGIPTRDVAVFADPVFAFGDQGSARDFPAARGDGVPDETPDRLPFTAREAAAILKLAEGGDNLARLRFAATKDAVIGESLREFRYVHLATHGILDSEFPELSSLVFSLYDGEGRKRDGRLRMHEIYQLDLRADLVVLSACRTARGKEVRGEGIVGWTQGFMYSGAKRVLVSLWDVDDESTAELMRYFYSYMLEEHHSPASALRQAQDAIRRIRKWQAPYHWAGFVLQGEFN